MAAPDIGAVVSKAMGCAVLILGGLGSIPGAIVGGLVLGVTEALAAGFISSAYKGLIALVWVIAAQGQNLIQGFTGHASIVQAGFMAIGATLMGIHSGFRSG